MNSLNQDEAAAIYGKTSRRLRQLEASEDPPPRNPDGSYPLKEFGMWLRRRFMEETGVANDGKMYDLGAERARLTKNQADKAELEVEELRGDLVRSSVIQFHWQAMVAALRSRLLGLPTTVATHIATPDKLQETQDLARTIVHEALNEIAGDAFPDEIRKRMERAARGGSVEGGEAGTSADAEPMGG